MIDTFLHNAGWADARRDPLAGDASGRRYVRLGLNGSTAVLMLDPEGDTALFARLSRHLRSLGLSAPEILAESAGLLLMEDLGDALLTRLAADRACETGLYCAALDALAVVQAQPPAPGLPVADAETLADLTGLAFDSYGGTPEDKKACALLFKAILGDLPNLIKVMILRDFHAENLLWLPDRTGAARIGLLDFQDAMLGHTAYDVVSLLQDARRDVSAPAQQAARAHFLDTTGQAAADFDRAFAVLGTQRNLRILGVFARLGKDRGKPHYVDLVPRVWQHLQTNLRHPALAPLRRVLDKALPPPTADHLQWLKTPCQTP